MYAFQRFTATRKFLLQCRVQGNCDLLGDLEGLGGDGGGQGEGESEGEETPPPSPPPEREKGGKGEGERNLSVSPTLPFSHSAGKGVRG